jgi:hypothetical protein
VQCRKDNKTLDLFYEINAVIMRYRGMFPRKSLKQRKLDKVEQLNSAIDGTWQTALQLSTKTGIRFHQSVKLLQLAVGKYDIETKVEDWIDHRQRQRSRTLYRRKTNLLSLYDSIFGRQVIEVPNCPINARVHVCRDD